MLTDIASLGLLSDGRTGTRRNKHWLQLRWQVLGCVFFAAVLPYIVRTLTAIGPNPPGQMEQTVLGSIAAILIGVWLVRSVSSFPGVEANAYIVPSFSISYGLVLAVFFLGRLDYNRGILIGGLLISIGWFYFFRYLAQKQPRLRIGVVPFGATNALYTLENVEWVPVREAAAAAEKLDAVVADLRVDLPDSWDRFLADCALLGTPVYHIKHLHESLTGRVELEHLSENNFGSLVPASAYQLLKHVSDWLFAAIVLIALAPLLILVAVVIRLDSRGPSVFRQKRVGYRGRVFTVYKFRTMKAVEGEHTKTREFAMTKDEDDRVTRIGRILRRTRIDELPQIINIVLGHMSWIGPRPEAEILSKWYEAEIPFYRYRHIVRPGITGWAQVSQGHVADVNDVRSKLHYDFYYIKQFSFWMDLLIIVKTIKIVFTGFGSR